jgi:hypothetical protein
VSNSNQLGCLGKVVFLATSLIVAIGLAVAFYLYTTRTAEENRLRVKKRFDLRLEGRVVRVQKFNAMGGGGLVYLRLSSPVGRRYDPRETASVYYAIAEDRWAVLHTAIRPAGLVNPDYQIRVGDSLVVAGQGRRDSLYAFRCGVLMARGGIAPPGGYFPFPQKSVDEWPPADSLADRGHVAHRRNCSGRSPEKSSPSVEDAGL